MQLSKPLVLFRLQAPIGIKKCKENSERIVYRPLWDPSLLFRNACRSTYASCPFGIRTVHSSSDIRPAASLRIPANTETSISAFLGFRQLQANIPRIQPSNPRRKGNPTSVPNAPSATSLPSSSRALLWKPARSLCRRPPSAGALTSSSMSKKH